MDVSFIKKNRAIQSQINHISLDHNRDVDENFLGLIIETDLDKLCLLGNESIISRTKNFLL